MRELISKEYAATRHILNPQRQYVPSTTTDIRATFMRVQAETQKPEKKTARRKP